MIILIDFLINGINASAVSFEGVEIENVKDNKFPLLEGSIKKFMKNKGIILAC